MLKNKLRTECLLTKHLFKKLHYFCAFKVHLHNDT